MTTCPRCGAPMVTLAELAEIARKAAEAHTRMKLVLPSALTAGVHALAAALPCHAGTCRPKEA